MTENMNVKESLPNQDQWKKEIARMKMSDSDRGGDLSGNEFWSCEQLRKMRLLWLHYRDWNEN